LDARAQTFQNAFCPVQEAQQLISRFPFMTAQLSKDSPAIAQILLIHASGSGDGGIMDAKTCKIRINISDCCAEIGDLYE
jgi:hypothetical protein